MDGSFVPAIVIGVLAFVLIVVAAAIRILREYERAVIFRLGRLIPVKGPGLILLIPIVDRMERISTRIETIDVQRQEVMTRDNVPVTVDAVVYYRVVKPEDAVVRVKNFHKATYLVAQTTLRSVLGQSELDELLAERDRINHRLQEIIDENTEPWGIKVSMVEVRDVVLPDTMKRAMARQAEIERERRAKVINAEGEFQAAARLRDAAEIIATQPIALQLRFLQTLSEVASENNSTTLFPVPIDLFRPFLKALGKEES
jgi:regulator of protease activity HflC (stomatin/prohibitin superfamily)